MLLVFFPFGQNSYDEKLCETSKLKANTMISEVIKFIPNEWGAKIEVGRPHDLST